MQGPIERRDGKEFPTLAAPSPPVPKVARAINGEKHDLREWWFPVIIAG